MKQRSTITINLESNRDWIFQAVYEGLMYVKQIESAKELPGQFSIVGAEAYSILEDLKETHRDDFLAAERFFNQDKERIESEDAFTRLLDTSYDLMNMLRRKMNLHPDKFTDLDRERFGKLVKEVIQYAPQLDPKQILRPSAVDGRKLIETAPAGEPILVWGGKLVFDIPHDDNNYAPPYKVVKQPDGAFQISDCVYYLGEVINPTHWDELPTFKQS